MNRPGRPFGPELAEASRVTAREPGGNEIRDPSVPLPCFLKYYVSRNTISV